MSLDEERKTSEGAEKKKSSWLQVWGGERIGVRAGGELIPGCCFAYLERAAMAENDELFPTEHLIPVRENKKAEM